jgi:hypothetical protein
MKKPVKRARGWGTKAKLRDTELRGRADGEVTLYSFEELFWSSVAENGENVRRDSAVGMLYGSCERGCFEALL